MYFLLLVGTVLIQFALHKLFHEFGFHHFYALSWSFLLLLGCIIHIFHFLLIRVGLLILLMTFFKQGIQDFLVPIARCLDIRYLIWVPQFHKVCSVFKAFELFILYCAICFLFFQKYFVWRYGYLLNLIFNVFVVKWNVHFTIFFDRRIFGHNQHSSGGPGITSKRNDIVFYWAGFYHTVHYFLSLKQIEWRNSSCFFFLLVFILQTEFSLRQNLVRKWKI